MGEKKPFGEKKTFFFLAFFVFNKSKKKTEIWIEIFFFHTRKNLFGPLEEQRFIHFFKKKCSYFFPPHVWWGES